MQMIHEASSLSYPEIAKFWIWAEKGAGCWEWQGKINPAGYGRFNFDGKKKYAHRISWEVANGNIPEGMEIDHACFNHACVNPQHLRLATHKQNLEHRESVRAISGYRGVSRTGKRWRGCVRHNNIRIYTTPYDTPEEANDAVVDLRNELFTHNLLDRMA